MPTFEIICLANSRKPGGRCIAGLKTDGSGWLRPVSSQPDGTLCRRKNYSLNVDREPQLFDILEIECLEPRPVCHQPENWVIKQKQWRFIGLPSLQKLGEILKPELDRSAAHSELFGTPSERVDYEWLRQNPTQHSLAYIKPKDILWTVFKNYRSEKRCEARFTLNNIQYDLKITDPDWESQMSKLPIGNYLSEQLIERLNLTDFTPDGFRFTISLGEPFFPSGADRQYCYKLIAAVINVTQILSRLN